jgi:hypothetical protein
MSAPPSGDPTSFISLVGAPNFNYCQVGTASIGRVVNTNWIIQATVEITVIGVGPWASGDFTFNPHTPILVGCSSYPAGNQVYSYSIVPRSGKWIREDPLMAASTPHRSQPFEEGVGACSFIEGATIFETADWFSPSPDTGKNVKIRFNKPDGAPLQRLKIFTGDPGPDGRPSQLVRQLVATQLAGPLDPIEIDFSWPGGTLWFELQQCSPTGWVSFGDTTLDGASFVNEAVVPNPGSPAVSVHWEPAAQPVTLLPGSTATFSWEP